MPICPPPRYSKLDEVKFLYNYNWKRWKEWQVAKYWASASPWFAAFSMYSMPLGTSISTPRIFTLSSCSSYIWKIFILCQFKSATITQPHRSHSLAGSFNLKQLRVPSHDAVQGPTWSAKVVKNWLSLQSMDVFAMWPSRWHAVLRCLAPNYAASGIVFPK